MRTLLISIGNELRADDGVAHAIASSLDVQKRAVFQLTPEIAAEIAGYELVFFVDADATVKRTALEEIHACEQASALTHAATPAQIVALSRALYQFSGRAFVCRVPASDFRIGGDFSTETKRAAAEAKSAIAGMAAQL